MTVVFTAAAELDLANIYEFIAQRNPERAAVFVAELLDRCESLAAMADAFPLVPRYERHGIRRRSHGNYQIFYRIIGQDVFVIHVLNGARDYASLLFPDGD